MGTAAAASPSSVFGIAAASAAIRSDSDSPKYLQKRLFFNISYDCPEPVLAIIRLSE
jgi:hypothetical protein